MSADTVTFPLFLIPEDPDAPGSRTLNRSLCPRGPDCCCDNGSVCGSYGGRFNINGTWFVSCGLVASAVEDGMTSFLKDYIRGWEWRGR